MMDSHGLDRESMASSPSAALQRDARTAPICVVIVAAAILLVWPIANMPYGDDTAYTHIALRLARTGHLAYNGWETAVLALQAYWGALLIRLFGFSFNSVRLGTVPFALGSVALCYSLVRRAGLQIHAARFVTLLFGLSPLFLPVAASYMTDVPGVFFMFASLYSLARANDAANTGRGYVWLALGMAAGFMGGTSRQVAWLVPLVVLPYLAWVRRRQTSFAVASLVAWILVSSGVSVVMVWFNHQPYAISQPSLFYELKLAVLNPLAELNLTARLLLMLLLICLPAALPLVLRAAVDTLRGTLARKIIVALLLLGLVAAIFVHPSLASIPWISSTLNWEGINGSAPLPGRPVVLTKPIRAVVAMAVYVAACLLAGELTNLRGLARGASRALFDPAGRQFTLVAMSLVSFVYFALVVVRGTDFDVFDRYLLPILPWAATVLLLWCASDDCERNVPQHTMPFAWALLGTLALYGIIATQDLWALARARAHATSKLETADVPRTDIDAGFEYNAWTELLLNGRLNSRWVVNPRGAYRPGLSQTPSVVPLYRLEYRPTVQTAPSQYGSVPYFSLLPPFHKRVCIDRVLNP